MMDNLKALSILTIAAIAVALAGCNSAMFQTAHIIDGSSAVVGLTRVEDGEETDVSDYSIFIKGSIGWAASRSHPGYEIGLTLLSPLRNRQSRSMSPDEARYGTFPNEWAGIFPEFKLQLPRCLPIEIALDLRLMTYLPERIAIVGSRKISSWLTLYGSYSYAASVAGMANLGAEIRIHPRLAIFVEHTRWLNKHHYPEDYTGSPLEYPFSVGIALEYIAPSPRRPIDPRTAKLEQPEF